MHHLFLWKWFNWYLRNARDNTKTEDLLSEEQYSLKTRYPATTRK